MSATVGLVTTAGRAPVRRSTRRDLLVEVARRMRTARTDDEAADALAAALELAREGD